MSNNPDDSTYQQLLDACFRFLSFRPRSEKEVRDFIIKTLKRRKIYADPLIPKVVTRLKELGVIDDAKFTQWYVEQRSGRKPKGKRLVIMELQKKGIPKEDIAIDRDEKTLALTAVRKKLQLWEKYPKLKQKQKIYGFLQTRGFDGGTIAGIVDELVGNVYNEEV